MFVPGRLGTGVKVLVAGRLGPGSPKKTESVSREAGVVFVLKVGYPEYELDGGRVRVGRNGWFGSGRTSVAFIKGPFGVEYTSEGGCEFSAEAEL